MSGCTFHFVEIRYVFYFFIANWNFLTKFCKGKLKGHIARGNKNENTIFSKAFASNIFLVIFRSIF